MQARVDGNGRAYAGSQRQIQAYVNQCSEKLSFQIAKVFSGFHVCADDIEWVSPLGRERYAEYRDSDFLRAVGLGEYSDQLRAFWPRKGPCWDALARHRNGCILVEAKSHVSEVYGGGCGAGKVSRPKIVAALERTKKWMGVRPEADWLGTLYQSANRYAFLYFLREICKVEGYLVNVHFRGDPYSPTSEQQWETGLAMVDRQLGMIEKMPFVASVFLDALG